MSLHLFSQNLLAFPNLKKNLISQTSISNPTPPTSNSAFSLYVTKITRHGRNSSLSLWPRPWTNPRATPHPWVRFFFLKKIFITTDACLYICRYMGHMPTLRQRNGGTFGAISRQIIEDPCAVQVNLILLTPAYSYWPFLWIVVTLSNPHSWDLQLWTKMWKSQVFRAPKSPPVHLWRLLWRRS